MGAIECCQVQEGTVEAFIQGWGVLYDMSCFEYPATYTTTPRHGCDITFLSTLVSRISWYRTRVVVLARDTIYATLNQIVSVSSLF